MKNPAFFFRIFCFSLLPFLTYAQGSNSGVEIHLKLIQSVEGGATKNMALSISIVNHSDRDVYLPAMRYIGYFHGIHLSKEESGAFKEVDLLGQADGKEVFFTYSGNVISKFLMKKNAGETHFQDSLIRQYYTGKNQPESDWKKPGIQPLFLKAGQTLHDFRVYNMEHLLSTISEYKIFFEPVTNDRGSWPAEIFGYKKYPLSLVRSNTLFYEEVSNEQLGGR